MDSVFIDETSNRKLLTKRNYVRQKVVITQSAGIAIKPEQHHKRHDVLNNFHLLCHLIITRLWRHLLVDAGVEKQR